MLRNINPYLLFGFSNSKLFLFAGQGTHEKGMLKSIIEEPEAATIVKQMSQELQIDFKEIGTIDSKNQINKTQITQPLLLLSHYLHFHSKMYERTLSKQTFMIGHSLGQFSALVNSGSLSLKDGLKLVHQRGSLMTKHTPVPHGMLIIKFPIERQSEVMRIVEESNLQVACINTKTNIIVAGIKQKILLLSKQLRANHIGSLNLPVSTAFHCKMLQSMKEQFKEQLQKYRFLESKCQIIRNFDGQIYQNEQDIKDGLLRQLTSPVQFYKSVLKIDKDIPFIQICHKKGITKFVEQIREQMI